MIFQKDFFSKLIEEIKKIELKKIEKIVNLLSRLRNRKGRLYIIGIGGSAANASHAVNDFRKLCSIDALSPIDNFSEFTATTNDQGFDNAFTESLKTSRISKKDVLMVLSVGGGDERRKSSIGIIKAIKLAKSKGVKIVSFTGKKNGYAGLNSDINISLSESKQKYLTPFAEAIQPVIWHCLVSHPKLQSKRTFW